MFGPMTELLVALNLIHWVCWRRWRRRGLAWRRVE